MVTRDDLVVGVFDDVAAAERAIADLHRAGFAMDKIDMVTRSQGETSGTPEFALQKNAAEGAVGGAAAGAGVGALAGAAAVAATVLIPGVGLVMGAGLLAGILGGAAIGAVGGSLVGPFVALEMSEEDAQHYHRAVAEEGRTLVLVQTPDRRADARAILSRNGGRERGAAATRAVV